ncbi:NAD-dependent epimerase/dehydratase family protein [Ferroplasma acidiphilum]|uniref:NAD-dependent epimerase/dehydratase family protein n=1 Tax=Ferroplasma acidiphilum TaxID=74969 RepID=A0A7K4FPS1_9ARCH|nr:NAD-dependent epimerase/dehydratase family protein [Ferroplasma acidiphilum]NOL61012.1 NAD-dependent epimerase/dehydratase family protein [Ferroplasma acidiphilum]
MNRILISGGNGFLGSALVEKALKNSMDVTVIDDLSTMVDINIPDTVNLIREKVENFKADEKYDYIVHLAARPSPEDYINHPIETILSNSVGTNNMLEIAKKSNAVFMYTSSSEVYGDAAVIPTPETYYGYVNPNGIRSCYDEGKRYSEALTMAYHRKYNIDTRIQRPFNVYGPRIRPDGEYGRVIPRFVNWALKNDDIKVFGDGERTRSFLYIDDWVDATWKFLTGDNLSGEIVNIGSNKEITINDFAKKIISLTNSNSKIVHLEERPDDPKRRSADLTKAKKLLGWSPQIDLDTGLNKTIKYFKERLE